MRLKTAYASLLLLTCLQSAHNAFSLVDSKLVTLGDPDGDYDTDNETSGSGNNS